MRSLFSRDDQTIQRAIVFSTCLIVGCLLPVCAQIQYQRPLTRWYPTPAPVATGTAYGSPYSYAGGSVVTGSAYGSPSSYFGGPPVTGSAYGSPYQNSVPSTYIGGPPLPAVHDYRGPIYYAPVSAGNGYFSFVNNGNQLTYWRGSSGYYYPWYHYQGVPLYYYQPIYYSSGTYAQALPPVSLIFSDMGRFLDEAKANGKLSDADYGHLKQRLNDLVGKEEELRMADDGSLSSENESRVRSDLEGLSREISYRVKA